MRVNGKQIPLLLMCAVLMLATIAAIFQTRSALAAQITTRSLELRAGATDGGSKPGGTVNHFFTFTAPTTGNVGSIKFQYCTTASGTCTLPTGTVTTAATLGAETGATGFSMVNATNGSPYLTRAAASVTGPQVVTYRLDSIVNPTTANQTFFVRIGTYVSTDTSGSPVDSGTVAASTATQIVLTGTMPESLIFCTGGTVTTTAGIPDCTTATSGAISFNQLFSPVDTATATSQMAASTNASTGYVISVNGATLTSGANSIPAITAAGGSPGARGTGQFGLNLKANTGAISTPAVGTEVAPAANGTSFKGRATTGYNTVDSFKFVSGNTVADSADSGAGPTDAQIFTASYIANVPGSQAAGTYTTTLTYICTATF